MTNMSPIRSQKTAPISTFAIKLWIKAGRIPVRWEVRESHRPEVRDQTGRVVSKKETERLFWPQVEETKWRDVEISEIENPSDLRAELFRMFRTNKTEEAALRFLNKIGAWRLEEVKGDPTAWTWARGTFVSGTFGRRHTLNAHVVPFTLEELLDETQYWYEILATISSPSKLKAKAAFRRPPPQSASPSELDLFASEAGFTNTLPVSLEWRGPDPHAVIETISAHEMLIASAWADVASQVQTQICARCKTRFASERKRKFCPGPCAHLDAQRDYKRREADKKRKTAKKL
jgi:hypothetical protein